jgi:hypothetical protein
LPILQHALNQIWNVADDGKQELDLIHLAKVGGLSPKMLSIEDRKEFDIWFQKLPEYKRQLLAKPSLSNILNAHANELMEFAADNYKVQTGENIDKEKVTAIIETAFKALTRTDEGRAVRRRTTLVEIANLHTTDKIEVEKVDAVLNIFRIQGNTFLKPFIGEQGENAKLNKQTILDITHESLIRNWDLLKRWAVEENENYNTWKEVEKQLNRWRENKFSKNYLLAKGPLSIFKEWHERFKPNNYWIERYENEGNNSAKDGHSKIALLDDFIKKSSRNLKRKTTTIVISVSTAFLLLGLLTYYSLKTSQRSLEHMEWAIKEEAIAKNANAEAELQKELALKAKHEADSLKAIAQLKEKKAIFDLDSTLSNAAMVVSPSKMNVLYIGVENPIDIAVSGVSPDKLVVSASQGCEIKEVKGYPGRYIATCKAGINSVDISCLVKDGKRIIPMRGAFRCRVKPLPDPFAKVGGQSDNGKIGKGLLLSSGGVAAVFNNLDFDVHITVSSFTVTTKDSTTFYSEFTNFGPLFSEGQLKLMKKTENNDKVIIEDIKVKMPDGTTRTLPPIVLTVNG